MPKRQPIDKNAQLSPKDAWNRALPLLFGIRADDRLPLEYIRVILNLPAGHLLIDALRVGAMLDLIVLDRNSSPPMCIVTPTLQSMVERDRAKKVRAVPEKQQGHGPILTHRR